MKITVIAVGKIKESFFREAINEYSKRLSRYVKLEIIAVPDEMTPDGASENVILDIKKKEGDRILSKIKDTDTVCTLEIEGKKLSSEELSSFIETCANTGKSSICFVIGGSLGLHSEVCKRADLHLSFSDMTFPHQLMRVILLEQIYRSFKIINHEPYHK
ncbi:MAG: 23S rRNA (pseudouridine(1915)-N(3))-methyltransferase RlmH [Lachnospiraceae bacterium]|nr:23S rRNA (pseudouridine(1915)-N(3))-methyltransferase RlmH [Lachnospiraceae bacterium]